MKELGRRLRKIYFPDDSVTAAAAASFWEEPGRPLDANEINVRSTDVWRTIQGAQSIVSGLLPSNGTNNQQHIPLNVRPRNIDPLSVSLTHCPRLQTLRTTMLEHPSFILFKRHSQPFVEAFYNIIEAGDRERKEMPVERFIDTIQTRRCHEKPLPCRRHSDGKVDDSTNNKDCYPSEMAYEVTKLVSWWLWYEYGSGELGQARAGPILAELVREMEATSASSLSGASRPSRAKVHINSAHDTTLMSLLGSLGTRDTRWPAYASSIVFELWRRRGGVSDGAGDPRSETESVVVRVVYNGDVVRLPWCESKNSEGIDDKTCPLSVFAAKVDGFAQMALNC
ncbi:hypothetical protein HK102_012732 [Quaeritorhiza haematococci]|nr:hypothetical protein HK102_012732 [Quaeritorhiza haematococci]